MFIKFDNKSATCLQNVVISRSPFNLLLWLKVNIDGNLAISSFLRNRTVSLVNHVAFCIFFRSSRIAGQTHASRGEDAVASLSSRKID